MSPSAHRSGVVAICATLLTFGTAAAATSSQFGGPFYTVETTAFDYNLGTGVFTAPSKVTIRKPGLSAVADNARGNVKDGQVELHGDVQVHDAGGKSSLQGKGAEAATLTADDLFIDSKADTYRASGHVNYDSRTRHAKADTMVYDRKKGTLHLDGTVTVAENGSTVHANTIDVDLKRGDTTAVGQPVTVSEPTSPRPSPSVQPH